jgi:hypothetical protein
MVGKVDLREQVAREKDSDAVLSVRERELGRWRGDSHLRSLDEAIRTARQKAGADRH